MRVSSGFVRKFLAFLALLFTLDVVSMSALGNTPAWKVWVVVALGLGLACGLYAWGEAAHRRYLRERGEPQKQEGGSPP